MKGLISRQDALDAVNNAFDRETILNGFVRSIAVRAIRDVPSAEPELELEELKTVADKFGYRIVKKAEKVKLLPCSCGRNKKPTEWLKASSENGGWFYKCDECNKKSEVVATLIGAKKAWNRMILEDGESE